MSFHKNAAILALLILSLAASVWAAEQGPIPGVLTSPPPVGGFVGEAAGPVARDQRMAVTALERAPGYGKFIAEAGPGWSTQWNTATGTPHLASGKAMAVPGAERLTKENIEPACLGFVRDNAQLLKVEPAQLRLATAVKAGSCWYVAFQQVHGGVPVFGGQLTMSFTKDDRLIMFGSDVYPGLTAETTPKIDQSAAIATALADCGGATRDSQASEAELSILPVRRAGGSDYLLCWKFTIMQRSAAKKWQYLVDAGTGKIVAKWDALVYQNITGAVNGDYKPEFAADATQTGPFQYARVSAVPETGGSNTVFTQVDGTYSVAAPSDPSRITSTIEGTYCDIIHYDGPEPLFERTGARPGDIVDWTWDAALYGASEHVHAPSVYHHTNYAHDYYKALDPSFTGLDYAMPAYVGLSGYNNAYWDGTGMTFGEGDGVNYRDFGLFSDVVYHEYTHGVTDRIYRGIWLPYVWESGAMNEGWSDYFGCELSVSEIPKIGDGGLIVSYPNGFRNLENTYRRETDWLNDVHLDSQMFSGGLWEARSALGSALMAELAHFARYRHAMDFEGYLTALLVEDDTRYGDSDLTNGAPHGQAIYAGFGNHGMGGLQYQWQSLVVDDSGGDADGKLDPGETVNLSLTLANGWADATNVQATLATTDPYVTITKATASFSDVARGATTNNAADTFTLSVDPSCPETHTINFRLTIAAQGPYSYTRTCLVYAPVAVEQLAYDDGVRDVGYAYGRWGQGSAVRMTPDVYPCHLTHVRLWPLNSCTVTVKVWDDDGPNGSPGSVLGSKSVSLSPTGTWTDIDIVTLNIGITSGSVYVGWVESGVAYYNGLDYDPPYFARSWVYYGSGWTPLETYSLLANVMVRARYSNETTSSTVSNITSTRANGTCKISDVISVQVVFSEPVYVTGSPRLEMETGATDQQAWYAFGSESGTLAFTYVVRSGDSSPDLDCAGVGALTLNGGTIRDAAGNDATLTLPAPGTPGSLGYNKDIVVDGIRPTVVDVTSTKPDGAYKAGEVIDITVTFSEPVNVIGTPLIELETGAVDRKPGYLSGTGSAVLTFRYTVQPGDTSTDLCYKAANSLTGTIKDLPGSVATLTLPSPGSPGSLAYNKALVIDTTAPISTATPAGGVYSGTKSVALNANESAAIYYTIDDSEPGPGSSVYSIPIEVAWDTTLRFYAVDAAGNEESPKHQEAYTIIQTISGAKLLRMGAPVRLVGAVVTASFGDCFYVEADERSAGIRVEMPGHGLAVGDRADVSGVTMVNANGEKCILAAVALRSGSGVVEPLGMVNRLVGGGDWRYDPVTGAGQQGLPGVYCLNNIGLLVRIWGKVTTGRGADWFYVDDGSGVEDGAGIRGVYVSGSGIPSIPDGRSYAQVTGISSCEFYRGKLVNVLLPRTQEDIVVLRQPEGAKPSPRSVGRVNPRKLPP